MQDKILAVIDKILSNLELITDLEFNKENTEYYFKYKNVIFSLLKRNKNTSWGRYSFYMYPHSDSIEELQFIYEHGDGEEIQSVTLHEKDLMDKSILSNLYNKLNERSLNADDIFKRLLED
jgi:hypothetical protein